MITLHDVLTNLSYGEFSQLKLGNFLPDNSDAQPDPKAYNQLASHLNLGLQAIYSRFPLMYKEIYIQQSEEIAEYVLSYRYAQTNLDSDIPIEQRYIIDSSFHPFIYPVLHIEEVYDELGNLLSLNDPEDDLSIRTPSYRSLQVPWPNDFNQLAVQYKAGHPRVSFDSTTDLEGVEIEIPEALLEALQYYMASRVFNGLSNTDASNTANDYYMKYTNKINFVNEQGLYIQGEATNSKFDKRGYV
jgi:hypothetical protein